MYGFVKTDKKNDLWAAGTLSVSREEFILSMRRVCVCVCYFRAKPTKIYWCRVGIHAALSSLPKCV